MGFLLENERAIRIGFTILFGIFGFAVIVIAVARSIEVYSIIDIGVGVIIILISVVGYFGVTKENRCLLIIYYTLMIIILILQLIVGVYTWKLVSLSIEDMKDIVANTVLYHIDEDQMDDVQKSFKCCGSKYPTEPDVPSCCGKEKNEVCDPNNYYKEPCAEAMIPYFKGTFIITGITYLGFGIIELLSLVFAYYVRNKKRRQHV